MYIEQVNSPQDIKQFFAEQLRQLAGEIRNALLTKLSAHGGDMWDLIWEWWKLQ